MPQYRSYCIPSDFIEKMSSVNNTLIIVNSSPSTLKTGHWLFIFKTVKNIEVFDPLGLSYKFYTPHTNNFFESSGKTIIQHQRKVHYLTTKTCGFHALLFFMFRSRGNTYKQFLSIYVDFPRLNDFLVENMLSKVFNIDFSALRTKCSKMYVKLFINKNNAYK
jgi:hypothetical protein